MPYNLDNIDCWHCGKEIDGSLAKHTCHLCGAQNPADWPWEHITSFKWRRLFREMAFGFMLILASVAIVMIGFLLLS